MSLAAHANNIYNALVQVKRPVMLENFIHIDEYVIVEQIIHTMLSTILIANHLKIDPFNQPSVDQYKEELRHQVNLGHNCKNYVPLLR